MKQAVVMTAGFYPKPEGVRFGLSCSLIEHAQKLGSPVLVSSGPHDETNKALRQLGATVLVQDGRPHGAERRLLAKMALGLIGNEGYALWTEEKPYLLPYLPKAIERMEEKGASALLFSRSEASWLTWSPTQQKSEPVCNRLYNTLFGVEGETFDPMLGPVFFNRRGLEMYAECDPTVYGVADIYPNLLAPLAIIAEGGVVTSLEVDITYPPQQVEEEEKDPAMTRKRLDQALYVVEAWRQAFTMH